MKRLKAGDPAALDDAAIPMDAPVVTVCGAGKVSFTAMEQLRARGYDARSLTGGMKAWSLAWNSAEVPLPGQRGDGHSGAPHRERAVSPTWLAMAARRR